MSKLQNKVAVVTGGNSGIGLATAKALIAEGANVVITGRNAESVAAEAAQIGAVGIVSDQADLDAIDSLVADVKTRFGTVDFLFLNAGGAAFLPLEYATEEHFDTIFNSNVKGVYFTVQKFAPLLNDGASVVFNTSVNASVGMPNSSVYAASKGALLSLTRVFASELASRQIRVNSVSPGPIETPVYSKLGMTQEQLDGFAQVLSKKVLLNRFGQADEIAKTVVFLASADSSFITGTEIVADGGLTANAVLN
jgi:NAD(P)-dependent dehydrogenase (short-subunit alcohol dehydrogenase family)